MACERWNDAILERLYDEIEPATDTALAEHLAGCRDCRGAFDALARVRGVLREHEPAVPRAPRVVVLRETSRLRPALLAASILGAALLAGAGAGAGYAVARRGDAPPSVPSSPSAAKPDLDASTEALVRREVDRRVAAYEASLRETRAPAPDRAGEDAPALTEKDLSAALAKFERRITSSRAADLDYMLGQIEASEVRTGARIGQTNQALRYVALASNPAVSER